LLQGASCSEKESRGATPGLAVFVAALVLIALFPAPELSAAGKSGGWLDDDGAGRSGEDRGTRD